MDANLEPTDIRLDPRIARINTENERLLKDGLKALTDAKYYLAAHLFNVEKFELYRLQGLNSMAAYYDANGIAERSGKRALQTAREIAVVVDLPDDKPLTKSHATAWGDARRAMQLDQPKYQLLLPAANVEEDDSAEDSQSEEDPAYQQLVERMKLKFGAKGKTPGLLKKTAPTQKTMRAGRIEHLLTDIEKMVKLAHMVFTQNNGLHRSDKARRKASYYVNLALYYVLMNGEYADACRQFISYEEALVLAESLEIDSLKQTRPDVFQGLFGLNAEAE